jgi:hypothetical protein
LIVLLEWLERFNERVGREGVPHAGRPLLAWLDWCKETGATFGIDNPKAQEIFTWFEARSPAGSLLIRPIFTGAFYFDAYFWPVVIPKLYGAQILDAGNALVTMPDTVKARLFTNVELLEDFKALWADCLDYGPGVLSLNPWGSVEHFWQRMLLSGDRKLRSAVGDLCCEKPGENAMQSSREACEMFLKAFLARDHGLTEEEARNPKKFYHHLSKILDRILEVAPSPIFSEAKVRLDKFPTVDDRYAGKPYANSDLWNAYKLGQAVAAEVIRSFTMLNNIRAKIATRF